MSPAQRRARHLRRIATAWLLVVGAAGVLGAAAAQAAARQHACCPKPPVSAEAPATPCPSLLPLACCEATVLPASAPSAPERSDGLVTDFAPALPAGAPGAAAAAPGDSWAAPRVSPLRLSVVLRL
jgi:hypothetical protein